MLNMYQCTQKQKLTCQFQSIHGLCVIETMVISIAGSHVSMREGLGNWSLMVHGPSSTTNDLLKVSPSLVLLLHGLMV